MVLFVSSLSLSLIISCFKVTRAGEPLSIDESVLYLRNLGKRLSELEGPHRRGPSTRERQVDGGVKDPWRRAARWCPPDQGVLKVNVDAAFNSVTGEAAVGVIVSDHVGQPHAMTWRLAGRCREAEEAETMALFEGLRLIQRWPESTPVVFESDCANLILKVKDRDLDRSVITGVIVDIKQSLSSRGACKIWREENRIAHNIP
jgi:hypothetical protein